MNFSLHRSALGLSVRVHICVFPICTTRFILFFCRESWINHSESGTDCWGLPLEESAALQRDGVVSLTFRELSKIFSRNYVLQKSYFYEDFKLKLFTCGKIHAFGTRSKFHFKFAP